MTAVERPALDRGNAVPVVLFVICLHRPQVNGPWWATAHLWRTEQEVQTLLAGIGQELTQPAKPDDADNSEGKSQLPRVPSRRADWQQWHVTWLKVRSQWEQGSNYTSICERLQKTHPELYCSEKTLAAIIKAGDAGLLDKSVT